MYTEKESKEVFEAVKNYLSDNFHLGQLTDGWTTEEKCRLAIEIFDLGNSYAEMALEECANEGEETGDYIGFMIKLVDSLESVVISAYFCVHDNFQLQGQLH